MLRARKKDVRIKPNRKLDKRSSRGMLYENEELRLRTIEINAEVERGQTDIKKLRRENDHLRREMWALRDEYERLEKLIKHLDLAGTGAEHQQRSQHRSHSDADDVGRDGNEADERRSASLNGCASDSAQSDGDEAPERSAASEAPPSRGQSGREARATVSNPDLGAACRRCQHDAASYVECGNPDMDNIENYQKAYGRMPRQSAGVGGVATSPGYETLTKSRYSSVSMEEDDGYAACSHAPVRIDYIQQHPAAAASLVVIPPPPPPPPPLRPSLLRDPVLVVDEELVEVPDESASSGVDAEDEAAASSGVGRKEAAPPDTPSEDGHFNLDHLVNVVRSFQQERDMHRATATADDDADDARSDSSCDAEKSGTATIKRRPEPHRQRHRSVAVIERPVSSVSSQSTTGAFYSAKSSVESGGGGGAEPTPSDTYALPVRKSARQAAALIRRSSSSSSSTPASPTGQAPPATSTAVVFLNNNNNDYTSPGGGGVLKTRSPCNSETTPASPARLKDAAPPATTCVSVYPLPEGDASASLLRLHAVDPHTVSFDAKEQANGRAVTVQEVIDELEQQLEPARCHVRGVRMLDGGVFFVSVDSGRSLAHLMRHSFRLRGQRVRLTDISAQTWIVALSGVPHYISDATVSLLLAAFGTIVGDVERRLFRGVDTGERLVRFRLKGRAKLPKHITVGGVRIQVRRMSPAPDAAGARRRSQSRAPSGASTDADFEPEYISTATIVPEANSTLDDDAYGVAYGVARGKAPGNPKIGRSFEYRSQLKVDLRMSAEVPVPAEETPGVVTAVPASARPAASPAAAACNVCEQQPVSIHPVGQSVKRQTPPPPLPPGHLRCRHVDAAGASVAAPTPASRESPPKSRASVNFEESAAGATLTRGSGAAGVGRPATGGKAASSSSSPANGILRKSASGEDAAAESATDAGSSTTAPAPGSDAKGKGALRLGAVKKTARSFSLVDTFRVNRERRKAAPVRVETLVENAPSASGNADDVRTVVVRRDSAESSSRSSRGSRKSNELPWCGCWGNGCL